MSAELFAAIRAGDARAAAALLAADPALARARQDGITPLLWACYVHKPDLVTLLRPLAGTLDLFEACAVGDLARARALLDGDASLANAVAEDGFGPLGLAAFFGHEAVVRLLLERGARTDAASASAMRVMPLHSAAAAQSVPIARLLLAHGAPVDARQGTGEGGFTPLMEAALNGQGELVALLLEHGADPALRDADGKTAADHAGTNGHADVAALLERSRKTS